MNLNLRVLAGQEKKMSLLEPPAYIRIKIESMPFTIAALSIIAIILFGGHFGFIRKHM